MWIFQASGRTGHFIFRHKQQLTALHLRPGLSSSSISEIRGGWRGLDISTGSGSVIDGVGEAPTELVRTSDAVREALLLESTTLDLLSVVTGLGDGGSGERDGVDEEGA